MGCVSSKRQSPTPHGDGPFQLRPQRGSVTFKTPAAVVKRELTDPWRSVDDHAYGSDLYPADGDDGAAVAADPADLYPDWKHRGSVTGVTPSPQLWGYDGGPSGSPSIAINSLSAGHVNTPSALTLGSTSKVPKKVTDDLDAACSPNPDPEVAGFGDAMHVTEADSGNHVVETLPQAADVGVSSDAIDEAIEEEPDDPDDLDEGGGMDAAEDVAEVAEEAEAEVVAMAQSVLDTECKGGPDEHLPAIQSPTLSNDQESAPMDGGAMRDEGEAHNAVSCENPNSIVQPVDAVADRGDPDEDAPTMELAADENTMEPVAHTTGVEDDDETEEAGANDDSERPAAAADISLDSVATALDSINAASSAIPGQDSPEYQYASAVGVDTAPDDVDSPPPPMAPPAEPRRVRLFSLASSTASSTEAQQPASDSVAHNDSPADRAAVADAMDEKNEPVREDVVVEVTTTADHEAMPTDDRHESNGAAAITESVDAEGAVVEGTESIPPTAVEDDVRCTTSTPLVSTETPVPPTPEDNLPPLPTSASASPTAVEEAVSPVPQTSPIRPPSVPTNVASPGLPAAVEEMESPLRPSYMTAMARWSSSSSAAAAAPAVVEVSIETPKVQPPVPRPRPPTSTASAEPTPPLAADCASEPLLREEADAPQQLQSSKPALPPKPVMKGRKRGSRKVRPSFKKRLSMFGRRAPSIKLPDPAPETVPLQSSPPPPPRRFTLGRKRASVKLKKATPPQVAMLSAPKPEVIDLTARPLAPTAFADGSPIPEWRVRMAQTKLDREWAQRNEVSLHPTAGRRMSSVAGSTPATPTTGSTRPAAAPRTQASGGHVAIVGSSARGDAGSGSAAKTTVIDATPSPAPQSSRRRPGARRTSGWMEPQEGAAHVTPPTPEWKRELASLRSQKSVGAARKSPPPPTARGSEASTSGLDALLGLGNVVNVTAEPEPHVYTTTYEMPRRKSGLVSIERWTRRRSMELIGPPPSQSKQTVTDLDAVGPAKKEVPMPKMIVRRTSEANLAPDQPTPSPAGAISPTADPSVRPTSDTHGAASTDASPAPLLAVATAVGRRVAADSLPSTAAKPMDTLKAVSPDSAATSAARGSTASPAVATAVRPSIASPMVTRRPLGGVTVAEYDSGLPADDGYERVTERAVDAARAMDRYICQLIEVMLKHGAANAAHPEAVVVMTFGELFDITANVFDSLVGIIKTAVKYGVASCVKKQLWQGQDDNEPIGLLKSEHTGIYIARRRLSAVDRITSRQSAKQGGFRESSLRTENAMCAKCNKRVYATEFVGAGDKAYHKGCFRCADCQRVLKSTNYCNTQGLNYCPSCFNRLVMAAGGAGHE